MTYFDKEKVGANDESLQRTSDTLEEIKINSSDCCVKKLLTYKGRHYCQNEEFVRKFKFMYLHDCQDMFNHYLIQNSKFINILSSDKAMEEFVEWVL